MKKSFFIALLILTLPSYIFAGRAYQVVSWTCPDLLNCYQIGTSMLGVPVWQCVDPY